MIIFEFILHLFSKGLKNNSQLMRPKHPLDMNGPRSMFANNFQLKYVTKSIKSNQLIPKKHVKKSYKNSKYNNSKPFHQTNMPTFITLLIKYNYIITNRSQHYELTYLQPIPKVP